MSVLVSVLNPTQPQSRVVEGIRNQAVSVSLPSCLERMVLAPLCLGSPRFQHSSDARALRRHVRIYSGLGAVTGWPSGAAFLRAAEALLGLDESFVPSERASVENQVSDRIALDL